MRRFRDFAGAGSRGFAVSTDTDFDFSRAVLDTIDAGVILVDPRTRIIEWANLAASTLSDTPLDQIVGRSCHGLLCRAEKGNCPVLDQGKDGDHAERLLRRRDGCELPVMKSVKRICIDGEEKLLETFVDISGRREQSLGEREDRYRVLFENSREAMMVLAPPTWSFVAANAATLQLFGAKEEAAFLGLAPWDVSPPTQPDGSPSGDRARDMMAIALRDGSHCFEWRRRRLDGADIACSVQLTRLKFAGQILLQATVRDLTPTERALSALRDSEERLRLAVEATGIGTYHWDHETGQVAYSPEFLALYDLPAAGTLALGPDLVPLAVLDQDRPVFRAAMAAGNHPEGEGILTADFRIRRPDGSIRWLMARGRTDFKGEAGSRRPSIAAGIIMDITERKRTEELAAVRLRLQEFAAGHTLEELLRTTLDEAEVLSGSGVGFYHFVQPDQETLSLQAWSTRTEAEFCQAEGKGQHYAVKQAGVWAECIRERRPVVHNDYASLSHKRGLPAGHARVTRELVVPILRNNKIVAVLGVGNKATDYTADDVNAITYLADVAWEIAQRKRVETDLRDSEEQLDKIFNNSANGIAFTDERTGTIVKVNDTWVRETGIARADAIGKSASDLHLWAFEEERHKSFALLKQNGRLREFEGTLFSHGRTRQFALNAEFLELRRGRFLLWELRDITVRKQYEETLRRYELLAKYTGDIVLFVRRKDGRIVEANAAALEAYGYSRDEILSLSIGDLRAVSAQTMTEEQMAIADAAGLRFETVHRRRDGSTFPVEASSVGATIGNERTLMSVVRDITERQRAELSLRASEELHRTILDTAMDGFVLLDTSGRIRQVNQAYCRMTGYTKEELIGLSIPDLEARESPPEIDTHVRKILARGQDGFETRQRRKDGTIFDVELRVQHDSQEGGRMVAFLRDISERKRAEAEIALLKHSVDVHYDAAYWADSDGRLIYVNDVACRSLGYASGELIGKSLLDINAKANPQRMEAVWKILRTEGFYRSESVHRRKDGSEFPVEILTTYVQFGGREYACGFARDIKERKQAETALRESEEKFRAAFMTGLDAVYWATLEEGEILEVNPVFESVFGYSREEAIGKTSLALGLYVETSDRRKMVDELQSQGFIRDLELKVRRKDGRVITISLSGSKVVRAGQQFLLGVVRDITERKRAEEETAKLTRQLQQSQKMESVGRLAGGVAHDFNNMLGVILGHAELALEKVDAANSLHADLMSISSAAQRSADLTRQLLAFARKQTVAPKVLNLNDTVAGMLKMVKRLIGEHIKLDWRPGEPLWPVLMDAAQIDQILANLCVNARDAIANVGTITIATGTKVIDTDAAVPSTGATPHDYVWLSVQDDGCGMDPQTLSHAFEPFFTTKEVGTGTGLGLATVYGIVKQNNGFIDLQSEPGKGTGFTIYLPRHVGKVARLPTEVAGAAEPGHETILLVEDEASLLQVTQRMLEKRGYKVLGASTPGRAIELAREHAGTIDLLVTDVVMPEMNGRDLAKSILSLYPKTKRLFMSGYTADVIAHQGVLDEGVQFIQKPFSARDLAARVRAVLDGG
jgi:two-component system cell cycle sensor histidine kinase/response regulator CckA